MKTKLVLALVGLGLLAGTGRADGPCQVNVGFHCNLVSGGAQATLGPWYAYFPYDAHFQTPAPVGTMFPGWPAPFPPPQAALPLPVPSGVLPPLAPAPQPAPQLAPPPLPGAPPATLPPIQPVSHYSNGYGYGYQVPSYWYGR